MKSRLEYRCGRSRKFWEIEQEGWTITTRWGRIGSKGREKVQAGSLTKARSMRAKKLEKGYVEVDPSQEPAPTPEAVTQHLRALAVEEEPWVVEGRRNRLKGLEAPESWQMFTKAGNRRLKKLAQKTLDKLEAAAPRRDYYKRARTILRGYVRAWERLDRTKAYSEAGDTAVREVVGQFYDRMATAVYGSIFEAEGANASWDHARGNVQKVLRRRPH